MPVCTSSKIDGTQMTMAEVDAAAVRAPLEKPRPSHLEHLPAHTGAAVPSQGSANMALFGAVHWGASQQSQALLLEWGTWRTRRCTSTGSVASAWIR